ncbi:hypothetical protein RclHR1_00040031 [Rhizophagus clarus]|uniref:Uncharacterized protein n=1 Tax=Rhizophagus clarus TaxID=94130 RepID=A0A2Z6RV44_9GLOM|nr:hypothetical protein RclHR1_00040031 [Rhizophagus clarus]
MQKGYYVWLLLVCYATHATRNNLKLCFDGLYAQLTVLEFVNLFQVKLINRSIISIIANYQRKKMKFKQYRLQVLVDGMPLEESVNVTHGTRFSVRFSAEDATKDEPIKAYLSVDGNWDFTYYQLYNEKFCKADGFWNKERNKKYYFKFIQTTSPSPLSDDSTTNIESKETNIDNDGTNVESKETNTDNDGTNIDNKKADIDSKEKETNKETNVDSKEINIEKKDLDNNKFSLMKSGGPGCVSVYFYRAKWVNKRCKVPNFNINKTSNNEDIRLCTGFDEEFDDQNFIQNGIVNLQRTSRIPIAELHIHYRDISYLTDRGFIFRNLNTPKSDMIRDDYFDNIGVKKELQIVTNYFDQFRLMDKEEDSLVKKDQIFLTVEKSNKRSFDPDEELPFDKRVKYDVTE